MSNFRRPHRISPPLIGLPELLAIAMAAVVFGIYLTLGHG